MKKKNKRTVSNNNAMKDTLEDLNIRVSSNPSKKKFSLKEAIWNYPDTLSSLYKKLIPLSYILIFSFVSIILILLLSSSSFVSAIKGDKSSDSFTEGLVGSVNSLNPLFVTNDFSDRAIQSLVFQKFVNIDKNGDPVSGVAESWVSSEGGLVVDFKIEDGLKWSDGSDLTIDDVIFTFESAIKLAKESDFDSVGESFKDMEIERIDDDILRFRLNESNPLFFKAISIYIVPKSRLEDVAISKMAFDQFSKFPMGSGKFSVVKLDDYEVILEDNVHDKYEPYIKKIVFRIYSTIEAEQMAFRVGLLDAVGGWDNKLFEYTEEYKNFNRYSMNIKDREKLIFFNIRKESLKSADMRRAMNYLLNKEEFLKELEIGGEILYGALPSTSWAYSEDFQKYEFNPEKSAELLETLGYTRSGEFYTNKENEILSFTLTYLDTPTNNRLADLLASYYKEEGVLLELLKTGYEQVTQEVIATRNFELLLYEVETTIDPDQYNLWHSLKVDYPDLNLSGYEFDRVDILLEEGRQTGNRDTRKQKYALFQKYLSNDSPVIFLLNPSFQYVVNSSIKGVDLESVNNSYARFHNIEEWYWE